MLTAMQPTIVHVCRHGQVLNPDHVLYGRLPGYGLSELGKQMAERLADHFADVPLDALYVSPLQRAKETMAPIAARHPRPRGHRGPGVIEAANALEGRSFGRFNQRLLLPGNCVAPAQPAASERGASPTAEVAARMRAAIADAGGVRAPGRPGARASATSCRSTMARLDAEGRRFVHNPANRECRLASVTSFHFLDGRVVAGRLHRAGADLYPAKPEDVPAGDVRRALSPVRRGGSPPRPCCSRLRRGPTAEGGFVGGDGSLTDRAGRRARPGAPASPVSCSAAAPSTPTALAGKVIVYNVWGSWCAPCRKEAPALEAAAQATAEKAQFVGINTRDLDQAPALAFMRAFDVTFPSVFDPDGRELLKFGPQLPPSAIPSTLVVDAEGRVAARVLGETTEATLTRPGRRRGGRRDDALDLGAWFAPAAVGGSMLLALPVAVLAGV